MKIFRSIYLKLLFLLPLTVQAATFQKGEGSEFVMTSQGQKVELSIYISNVQAKGLGVEMHFGSGGILASNMWQQFQMSVNSSGPVKINQGFIKTGSTKPVERMTEEQFYLNEGVQIQDFLFSKKEDIEQDFIGNEVVELPAGSVMAKHYRKSNNGQTVDYWISTQVKPIGLVKLVSKSKKKKTNNYTIELSSLLKNVKAAIDPHKAIPMTTKTKELLSSAAKK